MAPWFSGLLMASKLSEKSFWNSDPPWDVKIFELEDSDSGQAFEAMWQVPKP